MADPAVDAASKRLTIEAAISEIMNKEAEILELHNKIRAAGITGAGAGSLVGEVARLNTAIAELTTKTQRGVGASTALTAQLREVSRASTTTTTSAGGLGDAFTLVGNKSLIAVDALMKLNQQQAKISADRYDFITSISEAIGGSSRFYVQIAKDVTSFDTEMASYDKNSDARVTSIRKYYKELGVDASDYRKGLSEQQLGFISDMSAGTEVFAKAQYAARSFYGLATGFRKESEAVGAKIVPDDFFRIQGVPIDVVFGSAEAAMRPLTALLSDETLSKPFAARMRDEKSANEVIEDTVRMSTAIKAFGMNETEATELVRLNYINTGEAGTDYFNSVTKAAMTGELAFGYSAQQIVQDITKMSSNFEVFGFRSADDFAKIAASAHNAHMTIEDLQGVMTKFNTFESAASAVGQLNAALGTNFDALELMTLKFEDPAMFIQRLRDGFVSAGKTFEELPATYRTMMTQQLGITMEGLRGIMDGSAATLDDLTAKQESAEANYVAGGTTEAERQRALDETIKSRVKITGEMLQEAGDITKQLERAANRIANTSNKMSYQAVATADGLNKVAKDVAKNTIPAMETYIKAQSDQIGTILETAFSNKNAKFVQNVISEIEKQINVLASAAKTIQADFAKQFPAASNQGAADINGPPVNGAAATQPAQTQDLFVSPGGGTVVTANFGDFNQKSFILDKRDELIARPPPTAASAPPPTRASSPLPAVSDTIRASLQSVGSSLRIELDVGQLTDLILRDIMMNKPNVFGGIG